MFRKSFKMGSAVDPRLTAVVNKDPQLAFLTELVELARKAIDPDSVILFGSRARGDGSRTSDVDLAFAFPAAREEHWGRFCVEAEEDLPTLLCLDLVNVAEADPDLLASIKAEGLIIYERSSAQAKS